jgi:hypothetical protein
MMLMIAVIPMMMSKSRIIFVGNIRENITQADRQTEY